MAAPRNIVAVRWSNGQVDIAESWDELLERLRLIQFSEFTTAEFKSVLAKRALRWSGTDVDPDVDAGFFFLQLAWAKLIEIVDTTKKGI